MTENEKLTYKGNTPNIAYSDYTTREIINRLAEYEAIGTIEECRTAVERMKPKKPTDIVMAKDRKICVGRIGKCPNCGGIVAEDNFTCEDCFQVLDWSE